MLRQSTALVAFIGFTACAHHPQAPVDPCASPGSTLAAVRCLDAEVDKLDATLTIALDSARRRGPHAALVDSAQAAWVAYRRAQCGAEGAEFEGGTEAPVATLYCWRALTAERLRQVREMYQTGTR